MPLRHLPILLALGLLGCPTAQPSDAGEDAFSLDATDQHDGGVDANDQDATDHHDAPIVDATNPPDPVADGGPPCVCAPDNNLCTREVCNAMGECLHPPLCASSEYCAVQPDDTASCEMASCSTMADCPRGLPCEELVACTAGTCSYRLNADQDRDGARDRACGGNDCQPSNPEVPRAESCNGIDDNCNGIVDDLPFLATDPRNCGTCGLFCATGQVCVGGLCIGS
jgi:hypothetical protein